MTLDGSTGVKIAASMLRQASEGGGDEYMRLIFNTAFPRLLADLLDEVSAGLKDHEDSDAENKANGHEGTDWRCQWELHGEAVAKAILYPPAPYKGNEAQQQEDDRTYQRLKVPTEDERAKAAGFESEVDRREVQRRAEALEDADEN